MSVSHSRRPAARRAERGNTLLLAMIVLAVLALLAVGAISMSGVELRTASSKRDYDNLVACARGGRQLLLSQFRISGPPPKSMKATLPGGGDNLLIASGHYDSATLPDPGSGPGLTVAFKPNSQAGTARGPEDIANKVTGGSASQPTTYTIVCEDRSKRRYEVEFTIQFGF